ncbi:nucleotide exchange factor GrpE [Nocardia higoensis]|uniref:nucleotide exchange factor GrpE n=1 Tax=Nocardia higoensis TaxID=228599 RepID=UPI00068480CB|nr:nucleotide exchange factor GrpE [Nocardia higoensis]
MAGGPASQESLLQQIHTDVANLTDLFRRRLMDDKVRSGLFETLQEQVSTARDLLRYRAFESLFREALLAVDRLQTEPVTVELVDSAVAELLEVFARRTLLPIDDSGEFDPRWHEAIETVQASERIPAGAIVAVHRTGYTLDGRLLRPAQVTVAVAPGASATRPRQVPDAGVSY